MVFTTQGIQNLFCMLPTLQQYLEDFPLELKFIKFTCLTETGKSKKKQHTFELTAYTARHNKAQRK